MGCRFVRHLASPRCAVLCCVVLPAFYVSIPVTSVGDPDLYCRACLLLVTAGPGVAYHPIGTLNPYNNKWIIKARVTNKAERKVCMFGANSCS